MPERIVTLLLMLFMHMLLIMIMFVFIVTIWGLKTHQIKHTLVFILDL